MYKISQTLPRQSNLRIYLLTACLTGLLIIFRNPDPLFRPELWAEDGEIFFFDLFHYGPIAVFYPITSSFHFLARLIALIAAYTPSLYIPAIYAWSCFFIYIFVFLYFLRDSFSYLIPSLTLRILFVLLMSTTLGSWEVQMNLADLMYLLGGFMAILSLEKPIQSSLFYLCLWSLISFSSPLFFVFLPFHLLMWLYTKDKGYLKIFCVLLVTFFISMINIIFHCWDHNVSIYPWAAATTLNFSYLSQLYKVIFYQFIFGFQFSIPLGEKHFVNMMFFDWKIMLWTWSIVLICLLAFCIKKKIYIELLLLCLCVSLIYPIQLLARNYASDMFFPGKLMPHISWHSRYAFISGFLGIILGLSISYRCFMSGKITIGIMLSILLFYNVIYYTNYKFIVRPDIHWPFYAKQLDDVRDDLRHGTKQSPEKFQEIMISRHESPTKIKLSIEYPF